MKKNVLVKLAPIILGLLAVLVYWQTTKFFYQQDEWSTVGSMYVNGWKFPWINVKGPIQFLLGQGRVLASVAAIILTGSPAFSILYISIFGIVLHAINSILVFFLARKISKSLTVSCIAGLFFALNSVSMQAVMWPATIVNTLPATTLIILSLFSFLDFLNGKRKSINLSFLFLYGSLFFKESGVYLFLLYPVLAFFFEKKSKLNWLKSFWLYIAFGFVTVLVRIFQFKNVTSEMNLFVTGSTPSYYLNIILRMFYYPATSFSLTFLPVEPMVNLARIVTNHFYSLIQGGPTELISQTVVLDGIAISISAVVGFIIWGTLNKERAKNQNLILLLSIFSFSFWPYAIIIKGFSYLESRYYYLASVPAGILLGMVVNKLSKVNKYVSAIIVFLTVIFISIHSFYIRKEINYQIGIGEERRRILNTFTEVKPRLSGRDVFYLTGDRNYYIGQGNNVPIQQGMGYTLLTWYVVNQRSDTNLLTLVKDQYLWDLGSQGVTNVDGKIFGYYWDIDKLRAEVRKGNIKKEDVAAFYYDSSSHTLRQITKNIF